MTSQVQGARARQTKNCGSASHESEKKKKIGDVDDAWERSEHKSLVKQHTSYHSNNSNNNNTHLFQSYNISYIMSSDNHKAYVAIPMDMLHTTMESDDGAEASCCRAHCSRRNYLLPKCLGVATVCILLLTLWLTRIAHHHHSLDEYGWNEISHGTHDGVETDDLVFDEKWLVDKDGVLIYNEEKDESVVFDAPQDESMEDIEIELWDAEEQVQDVNEEAVDEPLEFFENNNQEKNVDVVDNVVEMPGLP